MKVVDSAATRSRTTSEIDIFDDINIHDPELRSQIKEQVAEYLLTAIQQNVGHEESPVAGEGHFPKLSKSYAKLKEEEVGNEMPNLELTGDMLNALDWRDSGSTTIELGVYGEEAPKADGHNNFSGDSKLPQRRFLPDVGQNFLPSIQDDVRQIIANAIADSNPFEPEDFNGIDTSAELYSLLGGTFEGLDAEEIKTAVLSNQGILDMLKEEDLLDLL